MSVCVHPIRGRDRGQLICLIGLLTLASCLAQLSWAEDSNEVGVNDNAPDLENDVKAQKFPEPRFMKLPLSSPIMDLLAKKGVDDPSKSHISTLLADQDAQDHSASDGPLSTIDLLTKSGFAYELHNSTSTDGYITELVRIVNPLADKARLKRESVVLYAGQGATPGVFLMTQVGQYSPHKWPASLDSSDWLLGRGHHVANRSLAITLANSGYDVWLVPARGVDKANRCRVPAPESKKAELLKRFVSSVSSTLIGPAANKTLKIETLFRDNREELKKFLDEIEAQNYWSFSSDDIVKNEFQCQLEVVLKRANCDKVSLITYSNGAFISFAFMAEQPDFASQHIDSLVSIAPAVFVNKFNLVLGLGGLISSVNPPNWPVLEDHIDELARKGFACLCKNKALRYSLCKLLLNQLYGHSDMFKTNLELSILDQIGRPMSAQGLRQSLQVAYSGQLSHYDYGPVGNMIMYNGPKPPAYNLGSIKCPKLMLVTGAEDAIVPDESSAKLVQELNVKPNQWVKIPGYNHLDLLAGHDNAERVNAPIVDFLGDLHIESNYYQEKGGNFAYHDDEKADEVEVSGGSDRSGSSDAYANKARAMVEWPASVAGIVPPLSEQVEPKVTAANQSQPVELKPNNVTTLGGV